MENHNKSLPSRSRR
jgi:hypothetical protein